MWVKIIVPIPKKGGACPPSPPPVDARDFRGTVLSTLSSRIYYIIWKAYTFEIAYFNV